MSLFKSIIVIALISISIFFGFRTLRSQNSWICENGTWKQHGKPSSPVPVSPCVEPTNTIIPTITSIMESSNQNEYNNPKMGFRVTLSSDVQSMENMDGTVSFLRWGPTQKTATELFDGFSINIQQMNIGKNENLKSLIEADIEQKKEQLSPDYKLLRTPSEIKGGYFYQSEEVFGPVDYYYLNQPEGNFLLISVIVRDPEESGFKKQVLDIITGITMSH